MEDTKQKEEALKTKVIPQSKKEDFEQFWADAVAQLRRVPLEYTRKKLETCYDKTFTTYQITYNTHDDTMVDAYFSVPVGATGKLPCVAFYHGGGEKRELMPSIVAIGVCYFSIDVRGQGGTTADNGHYTCGDPEGGLMTRGILDKEQFYMRNIYLDAVRAMDVIASLPEVDPDRIVTFGGSQGGALSIAASALSGKSQHCFSSITSYCCLDRRTELGSGMFRSLHEYLEQHPQEKQQALETLTYFDTLNMVSLLKVPVSFCLCLADPICLPEFVYSAYAHTPGEKEIDLYPDIGHRQPQAWRYYAYTKISKL